MRSELSEWAKDLAQRLSPYVEDGNTTRMWQMAIDQDQSSAVAADCISLALARGSLLTEHDLEMTRRAVEIGWGVSFRKVGQQILADVERSLGLVAA